MLTRRLLSLLVISLACLPAGSAVAVERPFACDSIWNRPLPANAPLDPASARYSAALLEQATTHPTSVNSTKWSPTVYRVPAGQPTVPVALDVTNADLREVMRTVPIPPEAEPSPDSDSHMVVWQQATDTLWEFWRMRRESDGWHAGYGGKMISVSTSPGYFRPLRDSAGKVLQQPWWGATATSLPLLGGLVTLEELRSGHIDHALAFGAREVLKHWRAWPAQRSDGKSTSPLAIPEGAHFRLDPSLDLDALRLPRITLMLARAAQRYGIVLRDGGGAVSFYAENPGPGREGPYPALFGGLKPWQFMPSFPWSRMELLKMHLIPSSEDGLGITAPADGPVTSNCRPHTDDLVVTRPRAHMRSGGRVVLRIRNRGVAALRGTLMLATRSRAGFDLGPHEEGNVRLRVAQRLRTKVKRHGKARVRLSARLRGRAGQVTPWRLGRLVVLRQRG